MSSLISIQPPQFRPKSQHVKQNPEVRVLHLRFPNQMQNVVLQQQQRDSSAQEDYNKDKNDGNLKMDGNSAASASDAQQLQARNQNTSVLRYTISPLPHHASSMQYIIQSSSQSNQRSTSKRNYWVVLTNFFEEWTLNAAILGGIESLDLKLSLKYVMGKQMMYGLVVKNVKNGDVWLGTSCFVGPSDRRALQLMKAFGLQCDTAPSLTKKESDLLKKNSKGQDVWISFVKRHLRTEHFKYLPTTERKHPADNLDFDNDTLQFGIMLITTSRSPNIESVTAMQQLRLMVRVKDALFFQHVERTVPMSEVASRNRSNSLHSRSSSSEITEQSAKQIQDEDLDELIRKEYVHVDLVSAELDHGSAENATLPSEEATTIHSPTTGQSEGTISRSWEVDWSYLSVSRMESDSETNPSEK